MSQERWEEQRGPWWGGGQFGGRSRVLAPGDISTGPRPVHEVDIESSLKGSSTPKHLDLDTEPTLTESHVNQWSEPRWGEMKNTEETSTGGECVEVCGPVQCSKDLWCDPWAPGLT